MRNSKRLYRAKNAAPFLIAAAAAVWPVVGLAATDSYTGASGSSWDTAGNWSGGVPITGTTASITGSTTLFTVLFNDPYTTATVLASLTLDSTSGSTSAELNMTTGDNLYTQTENVGVNDVATLVQNSGTNSVSGSLTLGAATHGNGTYSLSGSGVLSTAGENIGDSESGTAPGAIGVFTQAGGTNDVAGTLYMGSYANDTGTYNLQGGILAITSSSNSENIGNGGNVTFNQTAGTNTLASGDNLIIANIGDSGLYSLSGTGSLSLSGGGAEEVGSGGTGVFNQSGGTNTTPNLYVGYASPGTYSLSSTGSLSVTGTEYVGNGGMGIFNQSSGTNTAATLDVGNSNTTLGTYSLSGGSLSVTGNENIGDGGTGIFNQSGGTSTAGSLNVGDNSTGTYSLSSTGSLSVSGNESIGEGGSGMFNQSGGTNTTGTIYVGDTTAGIYSLSGTGSLSVSGENIGQGGTGTFNQSGGTNTAGTLEIGAGASGSYSLSGTGLLSVSGVETVGQDAPGTFNQSGGMNAAGTLNLGFDGTGTFSLSNGTNTVGTLDVGLQSAGVYSLSGTGSLSVSANAYVGGTTSAVGTKPGILAISSGTSTMTVSGTLTVWNSAGTSVSLSAGTLNVVGLNLSGNPSLLNWTGGTLNFINGYTINNSFALGPSITLSSGMTLSTSAAAANNGSIILAGGALVGTGTLTNNQTISGYGTLAEPIINNASIFAQSGQTLTNNGQITLNNNGELGGAVALVNDGQINGNGVIGGSGGFANAGQLSPSGGNLTISNSGPVTNTGNITLSANQLELTGSALTNSGSVTLNGSTINGPATLTNNGLISGPGDITAPLSNSGVIALASGALSVPAFTNSGEIQLGGITAILSGGTIINNGTLYGVGDISASITNNGTVEAVGGVLTLIGPLTNSSSGLITAGAGNKVLLLGGALANAGVINLTGGTFDSNGATVNNTGQISGWGILRTGGLTNAGAFTLTGGTSTVNGPVTNNLNQTITVQYQPAIFTGSVTNNGTIKATNTTITFAGPYSGTAYSSDPSTNIFQNNVTIAPGGSMTGNTGDQYLLSGGTFTNQGTFSNGGLLQSSDATVNNGILTVFNTSANYLNGKITGTGTLAVGNGSTPGYLQLTAGDFSDAQSAVTIATSSTLDLTNNSLLINFTGSDPRSIYQALVNNGDDGGSWTGTTSITSSAVAAYDTLHPFAYMVALADGGDGSGNTSLGSQQLEITAALAGDCNLDGKVDSTDLGIVLGDFGKTGQDWDEGSFNGSGTVDSTNLGLLLANWQQSSSLSISDLDAIQSVTGDSVVANADGIGYQLVSVPEPGTSGLLIMAATGILAWRRRRHATGNQHRMLIE